MKIKRLKLYNSKGIWNGSKQKLSEIEIDFTVFKKGIIGLYGVSGSGKSTILYNLNPYRTNFKGKFFADGYRELEFEFKGNDYLSKVYQDKAMLFRNDVLLNPSQKVSTYDEVLEEEIGAEDVFFKLMYAGHDFSNILTLTKGQRKEIIVNYLLDYLKDYELYSAKLKQDETADTVKFETLSNEIGRIELNSDEIIKLEEDIINTTFERDNLRTLVTKLNEDQVLFDEKEIELQTIKQQVEFKFKDMAKQAMIIKEAESKLDSMDNKLTKLQTEYQELINKIQNEFITTETTESVMKKIEDVDRIINEKIKQQAEQNNKRRELKEKTNTLHEKKTELLRLEKAVPPCNSDLQIKCPLTKNVDYSFMLTELQNKVDDYAEEVVILENEVDSFYNISLTEDKNQKNELNILLNKINENSKIDGYKQLANKIQNDAEELIVEIEELETKQEKDKAILRQTEREKNTLESCCKNEYIDYRDRILIEEKNITAKESTIQFYNDRIKTLKDELKSTTKMKAELDILADRMNDYTMLINFFGKTGGMIHDIEMAGQQVSEVANRLLENYLEKSIIIKFDTLKENSKGEMKEVFDITCSINGQDWQDSTDLSGGEKVLVSNAIREGMSYLRQDNDFKTVFLDELDGSLDAEARIGFVKLLEQGNELNGRDFTILITHSDGVKAHLEQYISLEEGEIKIIS